MDAPEPQDSPAPQARPRTRWAMAPRRDMPLVQLLPNLMTVAAICAGLMAIRLAARGDFLNAVALIIVAAVR